MLVRALSIVVVSVIAATSTDAAEAQVNSGSNGSDGVFNPTSDVVIDMADHADGIYHYTSVNVPEGVTVTFKPNAQNAPVTWLVQGQCTIAGSVRLTGQSVLNSAQGAHGGPGGHRGGNGGVVGNLGSGPGGGGSGDGCYGGNASFATAGARFSPNLQATPGAIYGNPFMLPLLGGSGGGGVSGPCNQAPAGGAGGGGAILIAAASKIRIEGLIDASGGDSTGNSAGGAGSGGAIRLVTSTLEGNGSLRARGGTLSIPGWSSNQAGHGRIRLDYIESFFGGTLDGIYTQGFQPIIIPAAGQGVQLAIQSVAGTSVSTNPAGVVANPDVVISAQQANGVPVVVQCTNVPLNSEITVVARPVNGAEVRAVGINNSGSASSSTATLTLNVPRGGGIIYATAVTGIAGGGTASSAASKDVTALSYVETGLTTDGERFAKVETKASTAGKQETTLITESGKRFAMPN